MHPRSGTWLLLSASLALSTPALALLLAGQAQEGAGVHEANCAGCHQASFGGDGSSVYTRKGRRVNSIEGLMAQVDRCNRMTNAGLDADQVDDLVAYLNEAYYKFGE